MNLISIGKVIDHIVGHELTETNFISDVNFLDAEIIFWDVSITYNELFASEDFYVNDDNSDYVKKIYLSIEKRKKEFIEFFNIGRILILVNPFFKNITFHKGYEKRDHIYRGSDKVNILQCIGIDSIDYEITEGRNISSIDQVDISSFLGLNKSKLYYNIKYIDNTGNPIMYINGTNYVISKFYKINNGYVIFFPNIKFSSTDSKERKDFVNSIGNLINGIKKISIKENCFIPNWVNNYIIKGEAEEKKKLESLTFKYKEIEEKINNQIKILNDFRDLKALFATDGKTLELIVEKVFNSMGFNTEKTINREDLIVKINDKVAVVEIKGSIKSAAEKHCNQLEKWVSDYYINNEVYAKGILIINTFKDKTIDDRNEKDFPDQMLKYARQREHCLITGLQLLCLYIDLKNGKIEKNKVIDMLFSTIGELKYSRDINNYIKIQLK